jgi:mono/diheme cytochrome c family protein
VTDVPEHLLQRSRERRAALGLGGGDAGGAAPTPPAGDAPAAEAPAAKAPAKAAPAAAPVAAAPPPPPPPPPPYVTAAQSRPKIPVWAVPVLAFLPIWGILYGFGLTEPAEPLEPQLALGQQVYTQCAGCHGAQGQGGTGRPLVDVELTFPDWRDHAAWTRQGSDAVGAGNPYGDPDRPGGQHISQQGWPPMPAFPNLTDEEIIAVVRYEREVLGGEEEPELAEADAQETALAEADFDAPIGQARAQGGEAMADDAAAGTAAGQDGAETDATGETGTGDD